jgi:predicted Zn-dependent protease
MKRRAFLTGATTCGLCALSPRLAAQTDWTAPARFTRPDIASDEGGLWALMDREETRLRRSPFVIRDPALTAHVQEIACRLAGAHCPDIRVYLVNTPIFNATMAPNGMMQVWSGLMLRVENEAQLAAILGHEIGHYLARHSIERLRDARSRSAFGQFLGLFGVVGAIGMLATLAGMFAYSREHEREADRVGLILMRNAGYEAREAPRIWENLQLEIKAGNEANPEQVSPLFATHPSAEERQALLRKDAEASPAGAINEEAWLKVTAPLRREWMQEEIKRHRHAETLALLNRLITRHAQHATYFFARGEVYRLRNNTGDTDAALSDYLTATRLGGEPHETHRALGMIYRARSAVPEAQASFQRYLELAPNAPDAALVKSYLSELGT